MRVAIPRHRFALLAATSALVLTVAACGGGGGSSGGTASSGSSANGTKVTVGVGYTKTSINAVGIIAIANQRNLWDKYGLTPNLVSFVDGPTQLQAMQSGQIDVGYIGGGASWLAAKGQATIVGPNDIALGDYVLARPDAGIKTLQDLKGKTVGFVQGGSSEMILQLALQKAGLTDKDIKKTALTAPNMASAFVGKQIDAAAIFSPIADQIIQSAPDTVKLTSDADYPNTAFLGAWIASKPAVSSKEDAVARFLAVYAEANDYRIAHPEDNISWAAELSKAPVDQLTAQAKTSGWRPSAELEKANQDGTTYAQYKSLVDLFVQIGRLPSAVDSKEFVNIALFSKGFKMSQGKQ